MSLKVLGSLIFFLTFCEGEKPNIIFLLADDLGWNDIGFHNPLVKTPNIDRLADEGVELEQSYVLPTCSPSRHAFLTGRYPFRDGLQHMVFTDVHPKCVPLDLPLLPEKLRDLGYKNHIVGKWHLGFCNEKCTPNERGFDTFYGYYGGETDHYQHHRAGARDFRENENIVTDTAGQFSTPLFTRRAVDLIEGHDPSDPLFLYMSYDMSHYPVQAPEEYEQPYSHVKDEVRRKYLAMVSVLDESVGEVIQALEQKGLMENTLIVFMSDNGGQPLYAGNNYPLRGGKLTLWEGGTRSPTVVSGGIVKNTGITNGLFHITDWYPTLINLAGGAADQYNDPMIDGVDQSDMLLNSGDSVRNEMIYNLDIHPQLFPPIAGYAAYRVGWYKLVLGYPGAGDMGQPSSWLKPAERCQEEESADDVECAFTGVITGESTENVKQKQSNKNDEVKARAREQRVQLYDLQADPFEKEDLSDKMPELTYLLKERLNGYMDTVALPMWPRPVLNATKRITNGFHGPGWCTVDELDQAVLTSRSGAKVKEQIKTSCTKD